MSQRQIHALSAKPPPDPYSTASGPGPKWRRREANCPSARPSTMARGAEEKNPRPEVRPSATASGPGPKQPRLGKTMRRLPPCSAFHRHCLRARPEVDDEIGGGGGGENGSGGKNGGARSAAVATETVGCSDEKGGRCGGSNGSSDEKGGSENGGEKNGDKSGGGTTPATTRTAKGSVAGRQRKQRWWWRQQRRRRRMRRRRIRRVSCVADSSPTVKTACCGSILLFGATRCGWKALKRVSNRRRSAAAHLQDERIGIAIDQFLDVCKPTARGCGSSK